MLSEIRHRLSQRFTEPLGRVIAKTGLTPNTLSVLGFLLNIGAASLLALGHLFPGGLLVLFAGVFDLLDGAVARATKRSTRFGAVLDSTLDRFSEAVLLFGLLIFYLRQPSILEILLIYVAIVGSVLVSYVKARAEGLGVQCEVGVFTRAERVILLALGLVLNQVVISLWILAVFANLTAAQRLFHVWQETRKEAEAAENSGEDNKTGQP